MTLPTSTYRLQLRNGIGFAEAVSQLSDLAEWGFSHLYLSPILTAVQGSTHGYDVTNPGEIDPTLGGLDGFRDLARAARKEGLGIILDIVPNHTAFSLENPWLRDVLRHGEDSKYARHFDIDWSQRLVLPFLTQPFEALLDAGAITVDADEQMFVADGVRVPLSPETLAKTGADRMSPDALRALHDAQSWCLTHWERERDSITHRRFFNVTGLIGMRGEDDKVFDDMHAAIFGLIDEGLVHGLRLDHIDGLADPAAYLRRLTGRVSVPIWVEKILTGDEVLPDWGIAGTTGYEAAARICRLMTDADGHARVLTAWQDRTGREGDFHEAVQTAKHEVLRQDLAAEMHHLIALADTATDAAGRPQGQEALREAVIALLTAFPRYRSYFAEGETRAEDKALMSAVADQAASGLRSDRVVRLLSDLIVDAPDGSAAALRVRFQQVTGALLAKAHEDTAAFRWNAYLAANDVGADPDHPTIDPADLEPWLAARVPSELTLTCSHDTKRSGDARMRLAAISHLPDAFFALSDALDRLDAARGVPPNTRWYLTQVALAAWEPDDPDLGDRLRDHMVKALREAKEETTWTHPDDALEGRVGDLVDALVTAWRETPPQGLADLIARGDRLGLMQTAFKLVMPGIPDIYQGTFVRSLSLTDPDNRRPVAPPLVSEYCARSGYDGDKARLTHLLLGLRRDHADFFERAGTTLTREGGTFVLVRDDDGHRLELRFDPTGKARSVGNLWPIDPNKQATSLSIAFERSKSRNQAPQVALPDHGVGLSSSSTSPGSGGSLERAR